MEIFTGFPYFMDAYFLGQDGIQFVAELRRLRDITAADVEVRHVVDSVHPGVSPACSGHMDGLTTKCAESILKRLLY